jgi:hypothetical protein
MLDVACIAALPDWVSEILEGLTSQTWSTKAAWQALRAAIMHHADEHPPAVKHTFSLELPMGEGVKTSSTEVHGILLCFTVFEDRLSGGLKLLLTVDGALGFPEGFAVLMKINIGLRCSDESLHSVDVEATFSHAELWHVVDLPDSSEVTASIQASFVQDHTVGSPEERLLEVIELLIQADSEILYWGEPDMLWEVAQERGLPADVCNMLMVLDDAYDALKVAMQRCVHGRWLIA